MGIKYINPANVIQKYGNIIRRNEQLT